MTATSPDVVASGLAKSRLEATRPRYGEKVIKALLFLCAMLSVVTTVGIVVSLIPPTIEFFHEVSFGEFFTGTRVVARSSRILSSACCRSWRERSS